jgi:hypothetical protein
MPTQSSGKARINIPRWFLVSLSAGNTCLYLKIMCGNKMPSKFFKEKEYQHKKNKGISTRYT